MVKRYIHLPTNNSSLSLWQVVSTSLGFSPTQSLLSSSNDTPIPPSHIPHLRRAPSPENKKETHLCKPQSYGSSYPPPVSSPQQVQFPSPIKSSFLLVQASVLFTSCGLHPAPPPPLSPTPLPPPPPDYYTSSSFLWPQPYTTFTILHWTSEGQIQLLVM